MTCHVGVTPFSCCFLIGLCLLQTMNRILGTAYSEEQRAALECAYQTWGTLNKREEKEVLLKLSNEIGLTNIQIRGWFQNRKKRGSYKGKQALEPYQVQALEWVFCQHSNYPSVRMKEKLTNLLQLPYNRVRTWFQSRRQRGVPAVLARVSLEESPEWNEIVRKLQHLVEEVRKEEALFGSGPTNREKSSTDSAALLLKSLSSSPEETRVSSSQIISSPPQSFPSSSSISLPSSLSSSAPVLRPVEKSIQPPLSGSPPPFFPRHNEIGLPKSDFPRKRDSGSWALPTIEQDLPKKRRKLPTPLPSYAWSKSLTPFFDHPQPRRDENKFHAHQSQRIPANEFFGEPQQTSFFPFEMSNRVPPNIQFARHPSAHGISLPPISELEKIADTHPTSMSII